MAYNFSFSYSKFTLWQKCPQAFKWKNIDRIDTGPTPPALIKGRKIHDDIGNWLKGKTEEMPERLEKFSILGSQIRAIATGKSNHVTAVIEEQMAYDVDKGRVKWFGRNAYYRFIWDAAIVDHATNELTAVDWKTGKPYGSYDDQMEIFSIPAFWEYPEVQTFTGYLAYLDSGEMSEPYVYTRDQFEQKVWPKWRTEISLFESDNTFAPTPSESACRFCDFGPRNLGICKDAV